MINYSYHCHVFFQGYSLIPSFRAISKMELPQAMKFEMKLTLQVLFTVANIL